MVASGPGYTNEPPAGLETRTEGSANETELKDTVKDDPIIEEGREFTLQQMVDLLRPEVQKVGGAEKVALLLDPPVHWTSVYKGLSGKSRHKVMTLRLFEFFFAKQLKGLKFEHIDKFVLKKDEGAKRSRRTQDPS